MINQGGHQCFRHELLTAWPEDRLVKKLMRLPDGSIGAVQRAVPDSERALQLEFGHPWPSWKREMAPKSSLIEVQLRSRRDFGERMFQYYALLWLRYRKPIRSIVVYLRGGSGDGLGEEAYDVVALGPPPSKTTAVLVPMWHGVDINELAITRPNRHSRSSLGCIPGCLRRWW